MEGVPLPPGIPGLGGSTDPLEAVLGPFPCVRLRNLPYDATLEDILILFQGLVVIDVVLVGQGEAFVIFANPMDFQMALQRNRQTIGRRFIEITRASRSEYYEAVAHQHEQERGPRTGVAAVGGVGGPVSVALPADEPRPAGEPAPSSVSSLWDHSSTSPPLQPLPAETVIGDPIAHHSAGARGGTGSRGSGIQAQTKRTGGGIQVGEHTGFLRMRGLPFSASKDDILKFFGGYNPVAESIVLTYRNDGRATGEAYVGFASPDDSKRAMDLHRRTMGARYIELFISNKDEQGRALARFGNR